MKLKFAIITIISLLLINTITPSFAAGVITELTPVGSPYTTTGDIQIRCVVENQGPYTIPTSYLYLTIRYGTSGSIIHSRTFTIPSLDPGESETIYWTTTNTDFPYNSFNTGISYSVNARWIYFLGIARETTTFDSVPTLGVGVIIAGILITMATLSLRKRGNFSY